MKKITILIFAFISLQMYSQEQFNISINGGIPTGNIQPFSNFAFGADVNYLFDVAEDFVVGPSLGILFFNVEDQVNVVNNVEVVTTIEAPVFLPISASIYFKSPDDKFYVGGEIGYGVSFTEGIDGGLFIKPTIGYHISDAFKLNIFYAGVRTEIPTYGYAGLGLTFDLKANQNSRYAY